jgi:hypothetical protein
MAKRTPEEHLTKYVIDYGGLMTEAEWLAYRAFLAEWKIRHGYSPDLLEDCRNQDSEALSLMRDGVESFMLRVRERILRDHQDTVGLNYCPKCSGVAKTPKARQCCWCFYDWNHDEAQRWM